MCVWRVGCAMRGLTFLQLVLHDDQEGHGDGEQVEDEHHVTHLANGRAADAPYYALIGRLATDGGGVPQDDQPTDQEDHAYLGRGRGWGVEEGS